MWYIFLRLFETYPVLCKTADYVLLHLLIFAEMLKLCKDGEAFVSLDFVCDRWKRNKGHKERERSNGV